MEELKELLFLKQRKHTRFENLTFWACSLSEFLGFLAKYIRRFDGSEIHVRIHARLLHAIHSEACWEK